MGEAPQSVDLQPLRYCRERIYVTQSRWQGANVDRKLTGESEFCDRSVNGGGGMKGEVGADGTLRRFEKWSFSSKRLDDLSLTNNQSNDFNKSQRGSVGNSGPNRMSWRPFLLRNERMFCWSGREPDGEKKSQKIKN